MSTPYDTIYGIPSVGGNATGNSDIGSIKHPGDYASAQKIVDFSDESQLKKHVRPGKWMAIDFGNFKVGFQNQSM